MFPEPFFFLLGHPVTWYGTIRVVGELLALPLALALASARGLRWQIVWDGWVIALTAAVLGGYALPALAHAYDRNLPSSWSLGAIAAVVLALGVYGRRLPATRTRLLAALDVVLPPIALMLVLGRIGCFTAGCCHGSPAADLPWAIRFDHPLSACIIKDVPVHPTQLYEAIGSLVILLFLLALFNRPTFVGTQLWLFLASYGALRFVVEIFRGDERTMLGVLSLNQVVALAACGVGAAMLLRRAATRAPVVERESR